MKLESKQFFVPLYPEKNVMSDSQIRTIERFFDMISQPAKTAAINTALRLGIVEALEEGQKTLEQICEACDTVPQGTASLLNCLIDSGMVEQFAEFYALSQAGRLTPRSLWAIMFDQWTALESALRTSPEENDEAPEAAEQRLRKRYEQFRAVHAQIQWAATGVAMKLTEALGLGTERQHLNILDLGCGSAVYSMAIAHHDPETKVHLVDDTVGLTRARATVDSLDLVGRVEMTESSELVFPGHNEAFDLVVIADQIHVWSPELRQRIMATAMRTLKPGGELAIIDIFRGQERGRTTCDLFELQLLIGTGQCLVPLQGMKEMVEETGFVKIQYTDLPAAPYTHGLLLAARDTTAEKAD